MSWLRLWTGFLIYGVVHSTRTIIDECQLPEELVEEIQSYKNLVHDITTEATTGSYAGVFYEDLASFTDRFGYRKTGTELLEKSIKYLSSALSEKELITKLENVSVPLWLRGKEMAFYVTGFRKKRLRIKALGGSPSGNVSAPLMVVEDLDELEAKKEEVNAGFWHPTMSDVCKSRFFLSAISAAESRFEGPSKVSHFGGLGALVRSITPFSIGSIHVGVTEFKGTKPIPAASISLEDADVLSRLIKKENIKIHLMITNREDSSKSTSQNLIADIPGKSEPESYMTLSGHIDSWDVGQGALDDGGGAFLALHALLLLKHLQVKPPRRTLRAILWTGEEMGLYGAKAYAAAHANEIQNWTAAFESDSGLFEPLGFKLNGNKEAFCILKEIASMFSEIKATEVENVKETLDTDISVFKAFNVPLMEPLMKPNNYFWFHHTEGDSMRVMNSTLMDRHLALITGTAYILADLSKPLPREATRRFGTVLGRRTFSKSRH